MAEKAEAGRRGLQDEAAIIMRDAGVPIYVRIVKWLFLIAALGVALTAYPRYLPDAGVVVPTWVCNADLPVGRESDDPDRVWRKIPVGGTNGLNWTKCYEDKYCARMAVPLDYASPDDPSRAIVALLKVPAKVPVDSEAYRGPVLFNPGGPGGSGVALVRSVGDMFQQILGDEYDIVGFDPRGVGFTTPNVNVFTNEAEGASWRIKDAADPLPNITADAISRLHARSSIFNSLVEERTDDASPFVSTASVARDMLGVMNAHGYDKIQYWGFSYGSVLGSTFASMFPNNVGRLVIDGVVDVQNYYDTLWSNNLLDTDKVLEAFFAECVVAGPAQCALYESTAKKVSARFADLFEQLKRRPLAVALDPLASSDMDYGLVDYALTRRVVFAFLYSPYRQVPDMPNPAEVLAYALSEAGRGNGHPLWDAYKAKEIYFSCQCSDSPGKPAQQGNEVQLAILCGDGKEVRDSVEELERLQAQMAKDSSFAELWTIRARCVDWKFRPKYRFDGPIAGNTSFPLLLIGNTADPVTPVQHAHTVSKGFNGSVVLTQDSAGHCSISASSLCTAKAVRAYFREGTLPDPGTVCDVSSKMFQRSFDPVVSKLVGEDRHIMEAWSSLRAAYNVPQFGLMPVVRSF